MIKNRSFESKFSNKLIEKHKNPIKSKSIVNPRMMASGGVTELSGVNKKAFENFFGVSLPKIRIHKTNDSIKKSTEYHAHSYAQGNNIYLGKDAKPIDTVEGQTVIAHEITHILQQKYLDMSSSKEMVDPSIELEQKAQVVEQRVRAIGGIGKSSGEYFRKWDVLPERSYGARVASVGKSVNLETVQRLSLSDFSEFGSAIIDSSVNQAKNVGGLLSEAGSTGLNTVSSVGKYAASGYTGMVAEGADLLGYEDTANDFRSATKTLKESAVYDINEATSHLQKSGKYGTNFLGSVVGNQKVFNDKEIENTKGTIEEFTDWKKDEKYNKTLTDFGNQTIGTGLKEVQNLSGDFFTMKYDSWQYNSAKKYTDFVSGVGSELGEFDKSFLQKNIITQTLSNSVKGAVENTIIKPGQNIAKNLEEGKFIESGQDLVKDANITSIAMNLSSGSLDGNITTLQDNGVLSKEEAKKFKTGKDTALNMTKLLFDMKNAKTKKDIAKKRTNTLNTNIEKGKYTKSRVKGLFTISENDKNSANHAMLKSSIGLFNEGAKAADKYQGIKDSSLSKSFNFLNTLADNKLNYKNLKTIDKIGLMEENSKPIQRFSLKGAWESTKNLGSSVAHTAGFIGEGASTVAKLSASGYTGLVSVGADALGYDNVANKYSKVTNNLQNSASDDLNDAIRHLAQAGKHSGNVVTQLVADKDMDELKIIHHTRNQYNYQPTDINIVKDKTKWKKLDDSKAIFHRMGEGNENNSKYVSLDGLNEAVYHEDGTVVENEVNKATYNFASPDDIVGHGMKDVLPYFLWGNSKKDPTTMWERITASYSGNPDANKSPIQRKILNKYKHPIQRWSLGGAWNSVTDTASNIGNSVVNSVSSAGKSIGKFASNAGTKIADGWNSVGADLSKHGKDYLNIGLNALSATGKIAAGVATAAGTGLFTGGAGFVAGGVMIAGGLTDINKVVKGVHKSILKHDGQSEEEAQKNRLGALGLVGLNRAEKFSENNQYMKLGSTALDYSSGILTAGTALHQAGGLFSTAKSSMNYGTKTLSTVSKKLAEGAYKNPNMVNGVSQVAKNSITSAKWAYAKGTQKALSGVTGLVIKPIKLFEDLSGYVRENSTVQKEDKSLIKPKVIDSEDGIKYAKNNRVDAPSVEVNNPKGNKRLEINNIDELSMKIFRQLKLDISLEYVRAGR